MPQVKSFTYALDQLRLPIAPGFPAETELLAGIFPVDVPKELFQVRNIFFGLFEARRTLKQDRPGCQCPGASERDFPRLFNDSGGFEVAGSLLFKRRQFPLQTSVGWALSVMGN